MLNLLLILADGDFHQVGDVMQGAEFFVQLVFLIDHEQDLSTTDQTTILRLFFSLQSDLATKFTFAKFCKGSTEFRVQGFEFGWSGR